MKTLSISTKGKTDIIDIGDQIQKLIQQEDIHKGVVNIFVTGSTAGITTIEDDPRLYEDLKEVLEKIAPYKKNWKHHQTWGDDNGASHIRASLINPSITIPVINKKLALGTWQKVVLIDFDTRSRTRNIIVSFIKG